MNLRALEKHLSKLSESELRYQKGETYEGWKYLKTVIIDGREVCSMEFDDSFPDNFMSGTNNQFDSNLSIKRNSRFNPTPEHVHSHIELNYVYSGTCPQVINGTPVTLQKNQVLLIDTRCPHSVAALGEDDIMITIIIRKEFLRNHLFSQLSKDSILSEFFINAITEKTDHEHYLLFHSENNRRIPMFFNELFCECFDPSINSNDILLHLFYLIMAELINVHENDIAKRSSDLSISYIAPMVRYIQKNYLTCTQESVAQFCNISPNYVTTLLKKHIGLSYIQLIQEEKLKASVNLLKNTNRSITEIANECGYENVSFFYKKFNKKYNCSPSEFRKNNN